MADELFFIRLITEAMAQPDPKRALREAFERILLAGRQGGEQVDYDQFLRFMNAVKEAADKAVADNAASELSELADRPLSIELVLDRDNVEVGRRQFNSASRRQSWPDIRPGAYRLSTSTGLVLWEGVLTDRDVSWAQAFPGENLPMAADTGENEQHVSQRVDLFGGTVELCVCPGPESASIEITLGGRHSVP